MEILDNENQRIQIPESGQDVLEGTKEAVPVTVRSQRCGVSTIATSIRQLREDA